jgi:hypothetical protein
VGARAAITHDYLSQITEVPAGSGAALPGPLIQPKGLAVDGGELYVADGSQSEYRIDKFDASSGVFVSQFPQVASLSYLHQGIAIGHATGETEVYVPGDLLGTHEGSIAVFGAGGSLLATWRGTDTPSGAAGFGCFQCQGTGDVAVDNSADPGDWAAGDMYVTDPDHAVVDVFKPGLGGKEEYVRQLTGTEVGVPFREPTQVAVDQSNGDVLVVDGSNAVDVFEPTVLGEYVFVRALTATPNGPFGSVVDVAVDSSDGDVYVADASGSVDEFDSTGSYLGDLTETPAGSFSANKGSVASVGVDSSTGNVYVGTRNSEDAKIDMFSQNLILPDVTTGEASNLQVHGATLNGTVNPNKAGAATCQFEYGTSTSFGQVAPCSSSIVEGVSPVPVQATLIGLEPDTTYYYRLQATNGNGTNPGESFQDHVLRLPAPA